MHSREYSSMILAACLLCIPVTCALVLFTCPFLRTDTEYYVQYMKLESETPGLNPRALRSCVVLEKLLIYLSPHFLISNRNMDTYLPGSFWRLLTVLLKCQLYLTVTNRCKWLSLLQNTWHVLSTDDTFSKLMKRLHVISLWLLMLLMGPSAKHTLRDHLIQWSHFTKRKIEDITGKMPSKAGKART